MICLIALLGLKPWEPSESVPRLEPPRVEAGVGDSVALPGVAPAVAAVEAAVAPGAPALVGRAGTPPTEGEGGEAALAVGAAHAVAVSTGEAAPSPVPAPTPVSAAPESPPTTTAPSPSLGSVPTPPGPAPEASPPGGPVSAGGPGFEGEEEEACAGDEYVLTITSLDDEGEATTILLEHIAADGSVETLELEGDLDDAQSLVLQLSAEGGCVEVEVAPPPGDEESAPAP